MFVCLYCLYIVQTLHDSDVILWKYTKYGKILLVRIKVSYAGNYVIILVSSFLSVSLAVHA